MAVGRPMAMPNVRPGCYSEPRRSEGLVALGSTKQEAGRAHTRISQHFHVNIDAVLGADFSSDSPTRRHNEGRRRRAEVALSPLWRKRRDWQLIFHGNIRLYELGVQPEMHLI